MRDFAIDGMSPPVRPFVVPVLSRSSRGGRPARTDAARPVKPEPPADEPLPAETVLSESGGGVGGNVFRLIGGSDCCLARLTRFFCTRFVAA